MFHRRDRCDRIGRMSAIYTSAKKTSISVKSKNKSKTVIMMSLMCKDLG